MVNPKPVPQHEWLRKFVGEWTVESDCEIEPGKPPVKMHATETTRMFGDYWLVGETIGTMPGCGTMRSVLTVGFDPAKGKFVGSWHADNMATMFFYEGELSADGATLPLNTSGPSALDPTQTAQYQDVLEMHPDGRRVMWSHMKMADGSWHKFMTATYTRK